jgi:uncharacterized protein YecT (DUF1311 family)
MLALIKNLFTLLCLLSLSFSALAESRQEWVTHCQNSSDELSGSIGWRICTGRYLDYLQQQQALLIKKLKPTLVAAQNEGVDVNSVVKYIMASQQDWERFINKHCEAAEAAFDIGNSAGDVMPSCLVKQYETRNQQLQGILDDNYER